MHKLARQLLPAALLVLLLGSVIWQLLLPIFASQVGTSFPEVAYLVAPYSAAAILFIACGQVALFAVWRLLSQVDRGVIFTRGAVRWVNLIIGCAAVATLLSAGVTIHMLSFVPGGGGPIIYYLGLCVVACVAFVLLMVVMRGLLESAIADRTELDEVI